MLFPLKICKLDKEKIEIFNNNYAKNDTFIFEGVWFRSQNEINKESSLWKDENSNRRRTVHFKHSFKVVDEYLIMDASYLYLSVRLENIEYDKYINKIREALNKNKYVLKDDIYTKEDLKIKIEEFEHHPKEKMIPGYKTVDITIYSNGVNDLEANYEQVWNLQVKGIREKDKRGNPKYIKDVNELREYLPAQIELGCGPSIEAGINPLYHLHEIYKVQRHSDSRFYFAEDDDLVLQVIEKDCDKYMEFSEIIRNCLNASPTKFHYAVKKMYEKGLFVGTLFNNNFDHLSSVLGIDEKTLRVYRIDDYFPKVDFDERAKSLICIGSHADRRFIQKQARKKGLKIIYVDPEGFETENGFEEYLIEGASDNDLVLRLKGLEFAQELEDNFLK